MAFFYGLFVPLQPVEREGMKLLEKSEKVEGREAKSERRGELGSSPLTIQLEIS